MAQEQHAKAACANQNHHLEATEEREKPTYPVPSMNTLDKQR
tara:strand:- start:2112 stop:2237 length:126 start_codon:yes stop_codon:yes gene_type:complete